MNRCFFLSDEVFRAAPGGRRRAVRGRRGQHPGRVPHQRPQPLGRVRERDEGAGGARPQRDGHHGVPGKNQVAQLHGHRRVQGVPVRGQPDRHRHCAQLLDQRVRQPVVHRRSPDEAVPRGPEAAASPSVAQERHQVRRGQ